MKINYCDKIYILHHDALVERKQIITEILSKNDIDDIEWVESFKPCDIIDLYNNNVLIYKYDESIPKVQFNQYDYFEGAGKIISIKEYSLYLKHQYCFQQMKEKGYQNIIFFEDDINISNINLPNFLNKNMFEFTNVNEFDVDVHALMLGSYIGYNSNKIRPNKSTHLGTHQMTRCTHAMAFNDKKLDVILKELELPNLPIDFKLNEVFTKHNMNVAWSEPSILQNSTFRTSLR